MDKPSSGDPERRWSRSGTPLFTRKERAEMEKYLDFRYGVVSVRRRRRKWREYLSPVVLARGFYNFLLNLYSV